MRTDCFIFNLVRVSKKSAEAMKRSQIITDFTGADLTGANLGGVSLYGVILCNTTMPDGKINNTSCKN
jgi:uncharacterized protein YjbI with pentapeptide repeats